ncbi:MAG: hypothetical protein ACTHMS_06800, partial [Jatrophihabitans sp.]
MPDPSLELMLAALGRLGDAEVDDAVRVERIGLLERLKAAASAAQARETVAFADAQQAEQLAAGVKQERSRRGIALQVGLARMCSPHTAARMVGWSRVLVSELPHTYAALQAGTTTE